MNFKAAYRRYCRKFRRPLRTAHGDWVEREGFIVRVESDTGVGYGEVAPISEFGTETLERAGNFLEQWAADPIIHPSGLPCCHFAVTAALQQSQQSVATVPRDYVVAGLLPAGPDALSLAEVKLAAGYRTLKWKIGVLPFEAEKEVLEELLRLFPEGAVLRLDANGGLDRAIFDKWLEVLGPSAGQIDYLEQPLAPGEEGEMAELSKSSGIPIALDESLNLPGRERWLMPGAWAGPLVIKSLLMGNVSVLMEQLQPLARQLVVSSVFETGIGLEAALGLADALPESKHAIGFDTLDTFDDALTPLQSSAQIRAKDRNSYTGEQIWNSI